MCMALTVCLRGSPASIPDLLDLKYGQAKNRQTRLCIQHRGTRLQYGQPSSLTLSRLHDLILHSSSAELNPPRKHLQ